MELGPRDQDSRRAPQVDLDAVLAAATERRKVTALARNVAARQLADYVIGDLEGVVVTPAETTRQLSLYQHAVDQHRAAHEAYLAADRAWTLG